MSVRSPRRQTAASTHFFILSHLLLLACGLCWFNEQIHPYCVSADIWVFKTLNQSLAEHSLWQSFWGLLNHRLETHYNLVLAGLLNLWAILDTPNARLKQQRIRQLIYFWICFELGFWLQDYLFHTYLEVARHSPSVVLKQVIKLSAQLKDTNIKDASTACFPSGHAFALIYWASFSLLCSPKKIGILGLLLALFLCLPRLFSGAHWASDILFSGIMALVWLSWILKVPFYSWIKNRNS